MTLRFDADKISPKSSSIYCLQVSNEPTSYVATNEQLKYCKNCKFPLFFLNDNIHIDCPLCHPGNDYSENSYRISVSTPAHNHYVFIFDILIPYFSIIGIINELNEVLTDSDTFSMLFITDHIIILSITDSLLYFDVISDTKKMPQISNHIFTKKDLKNTIFPSISSIFVFCPPEISPICDPFTALNVSLSLTKEPAKIIMFLNRSICKSPISLIDEIGTKIKETNSVISIGATKDFIKLTAIAQHSMGTVFGASHIYSGEIRKILKICKRPNSLKLYVPNYIEFSKVSGCIGKIHKTTNHSALELQMIAGGAVQMSCEFSNKQKLIRMVEITETATSKYVKLHTIDADIANSVCNYNENIRNMIKLKFFASDFLRNKWKGMRIDWKITESTNKENKENMEKTCLASFGDDEQMDVLSLYFILHMYGDMKDISYILQNEGKDMILIMPPFAFCSPKCSFDVLARFEYPLEL